MSVTVGALEDPTCAYSTECDSKNVNQDHIGTNRRVLKVGIVSNNQLNFQGLNSCAKKKRFSFFYIPSSKN